MMMTRWKKTLAATGVIGAGLVAWSAIAARTNEGLVPADGTFCDVDGARLHYTDEGSGPVLVMIHGLMGQMRNFSYALNERLAGSYRIINIDRPGWGYSTYTSPKRPNIPEQAAMIAALLGRLEIEKATIVGHSLGGAIALALALNHPERVANLALIAPLTQPMDTPPEAFKSLAVPESARGLVSWTLAVPMTALTGAVVAKKVFAPDDVPLDFGIKGGGLLSVRPKSFQAGAFEMMGARVDMEALVPRYAGLDLPVSILFGSGDNVLTVDAHGRATEAMIPRCELKVIDGGHMLPVTHPAETAAFVRGAAARLV